MEDATGFQFVTAAYLIRINNQKATTLNELRACLDQANDASIFYHTFQSLGRHHFLTEGFSNDFAEWVLNGLNRPVLAERLAGLDVRDYLSIAELRGDLARIVGEFCDEHPREAEVSAFEPFYFCESAEITVPMGEPARTMEEFRRGLEGLSHASLHYHFLVSRLRLQLKTNDFSYWLEMSQQRPDLGRRLERIDIYTNTLDSARETMVRILNWGGHA
jgi:hypothetical protein